jgi:arylsulfatase A-like enzyme
LYYALQQPHVPRTPHPRFVGKSGMGPRGDVIVEADWCIGEFIKTLEKEGLLENTLIILSSDNGPVLNDGYYDDAVEKLGEHTPWGPLRGGKYSLFEAGTRVPFISYWKGKIQPITKDEMISQIDIFSSLASLTGSSTQGPDSQNLLDLLMGKRAGRQGCAGFGSHIPHCLKKRGLGNDSTLQWPAVSEHVNIELGNDKNYQLYHLQNDLGQLTNLAESNPEKLDEMIAVFKEIRGNAGEAEPLELK